MIKKWLHTARHWHNNGIEQDQLAQMALDLLRGKLWVVNWDYFADSELNEAAMVIGPLTEREAKQIAGELATFEQTITVFCHPITPPNEEMLKWITD